MHASIWKFAGDPDDLLGRYEAMLAEIPRPSMRFHACLRAHDGIVVIDTCPSADVFEAFAAGTFPELRKRHGIPEPTQMENFPVHIALANGEPIV